MGITGVFILFIYLADPGPVRHLACYFKQSRKEPLQCTWSPPEQSNGQIQHYIINVKHNHQIIYNTTEKRSHWKSSLDLTFNEAYTVVVSAVTYVVGPPVSTRVVFTKPGTLCLS